ncbi:MAG: hypothetical protein HKN42_14695 [Granulosicoccus sp.]|nr:hypothetical protein [Granulosicoccus sp.]
MNQDPLFSEHWYRVKDLKPRLASDVISRRHSYRGIPCYVLHRQSTGAYHRVSIEVFSLLAALDGTVTLDETWQDAIQSHDDKAPTQAELLALLARLHEAELITVNRKLDAEQLFSRARDNAHKEVKQRYLNPLFLRFTLFDPDRILNRLQPLARCMYSRAALLAWVGLIVLGLFVLLPHWSNLRYEVSSFDVFSPVNLTLFLLIYPILKLAHEVAHGLAVKRFGGEVHEMGITLMVFLPLPYVDASASTALPGKWDRILVSAAGILVELSIASMAAFVWSFSGGTLHDVALTVMLIGGASTVLFNGNPLLKFDGYYILSDYLEIPNLADRSRQYLLGTTGQKLFGLSQPKVELADRREGAWLLFYGLFSSAYKLALMSAIALMLSERFFIFGTILALWVAVTLIGLPLYRLLVFIAVAPQPSRPRTVLVTAGVSALFLGILAFLPLPLNTVASGVVWLPENAIVRVQSPCEVTQLLVQPGASVMPGESLFFCEDYRLDTERLTLQSRLDELRAKRMGLDLADRVRHEKFSLDIDTLQANLERTREKISGQLVTAQSMGRFFTASSTDFEGQFIAPGDLAAYVVPGKTRTVRVAIEQADTTWFQRDATAAELQFAEQADKRRVYASKVHRQTPQSTKVLVSAGLTTAGGGRIVADPAGDGLTVREPVFDIELAWPDDAPPVNVGSHVSVVFRHAPEPILSRLITTVQRAFLGRLEV